MEDYPMQGEIFPPDSRFNSTHQARKKRQATRIEVRELKESKGSGRSVKDISGQRFGKLTAVEITGQLPNGQRVWLCRCDCGHEILATSSHLIRKRNPLNHCGCLGVDKSGVSKPGTRGIGKMQSPRPKRNKPRRAFNSLYANYRYGAIDKRGYEWALSKRQFLELISGDCHYCGIKPEQVYRVGPHELIYNGIDRLDNKLGYEPDNCVPCCWTCNSAKQDRPADEFLDWIKRVYEYQEMADNK